MFKKLKQKINEEQSPQRNAQSPQQAQVSCCVGGSLQARLTSVYIAQALAKEASCCFADVMIRTPKLIDSNIS